MKKTISITLSALVLLLSSCASNIHTTSDGQRWKSAGKNHHYQIMKGCNKSTREKGVPSCVQSW